MRADRMRKRPSDLTDLPVRNVDPQRFVPPVDAAALSSRTSLARCAVRKVFPSASLEREGKAHACPPLAAADVDAVG